LRAEALAGRGRGDEAIRFELAQSGIEDEHIVAAIDALEPEVRRAGLIADRLGSTAKTASALARKGFGHDSIAAALGGVVARPDDGNV
jgi:SOS response regulatory protein OraA/RecX